MKKPQTFVKAADSNVPVERSVEAIKQLVRKYGASGFGVSEDYRTQTVVVSFVLNGPDGGHMPVQIPVRIRRVYEALYGANPIKASNQHMKAPEVEQRRQEQAERTAWRQLHLVVEALLTAVQLGITTLTEAFMGHVVVDTGNGRTERMADYLERTQGALAPGVRALLASPAQNVEVIE